ncbi:hypothetical protein IM660_10350 [Ruania alkalisoli]|uniref:Uncharacterized protein n=1 Tax=Ruania alkalisoli TaxID=2779775 RepID=A0A7M1SNU3_9MICO|nr:hypothetical protein [Ruania alkalisoli]QOR69135.1 hypothetical protein IM660_10350 [Ruania alkalisoli]
MTTDNYLVTDEDGTPAAFVDMDQIQSQAVRFAYDMAAACGDRAELERVSEQHLAEAGTGAFGYVAAAALRNMTEQVLDPVLDVTDRLHETGHLAHDLRAGLAEAAANARKELG